MDLALDFVTIMFGAVLTAIGVQEANVILAITGTVCFLVGVSWYRWDLKH